MEKECQGLSASFAAHLGSLVFSLQFDIEKTGPKRVKVVLKETWLSGVKNCGISCGSGRDRIRTYLLA
ncbi:hypothetical protein NQ317_005287 [Molorchus minor]|uniref:Uncharacterized protein n=1 Tax=Molorchus minor TaxID=1323400 RepID=A0ABQ9IZE8_9CUCU|nr:hypothetical protein NQ317_005287 [Molorchus minor]